MMTAPDLQQKLICVGSNWSMREKVSKIYAAAIGEDRPRIERIYGDGYLDITISRTAGDADQPDRA